MKLWESFNKMKNNMDTIKVLYMGIENNFANIGAGTWDHIPKGSSDNPALLWDKLYLDYCTQFQALHVR